MNTTKSILAFIALATLAGCGAKTKEAKIAEFKKKLAEEKGVLATAKGKIKVLEDSLSHLESKSTDDLAMVSVTPVSKSSFNHYLDIQARVESDNNVMVAAQMPGKVIRMLVKDGDRVGKGQVIALLDAETISKGIEEVKNQYQLVKTVYEKQKSLWEQKIGTEIQFLQAENNKVALEKKIESLNAQLEMTRVKSPLSGVVEQTFVKEGEMAAGPVARVVNGSDYKVVADVAEGYTSNINQGDAITIEFPDLKKSVSQRITKVGAVINPMSRTFTVESRIGNIAGLKPNMIAKVHLQDYKKGSAFVVPVNLVQNDIGGQFVYVEKGGIAVKKPVKTGMAYGNAVEIIEGLELGDRLITVGYLDLVVNQKVVVK